MVPWAPRGKILKWWIPDKFIVVDQIPGTSIGKYDKKAMRAAYPDSLAEG
jgi:fatty-acyl-CoA synthase